MLDKVGSYYEKYLGVGPRNQEVILKGQEMSRQVQEPVTGMEACTRVT